MEGKEFFLSLSSSYLEACGAPVHELDGALGLDGGDGSVDVLGHHVPSVQHAAGHVLAVARVALHHLSQYKSVNKSFRRLV